MATGIGSANQSDIQRAINKLVEQNNADQGLPTRAAAAPIPSKVGVGTTKGETAGGTPGGAGIAGPLTELSYASRLTWPDMTVTSSDGLFVWHVSPTKQIHLVDANNVGVLVNFSQPT